MRVGNRRDQRYVGRVELALEEEKPGSVKVGGNAVTVMQGEMIVNE